MPILPPKIHRNQQLFSDHYLDVTLPQRQDWQELAVEAEPVMQEVAALYAHYVPSDKEAQAEHALIRPILTLLGHTFEVQPSLATPDGTKVPDYIFYRDIESLLSNKGKKLDEENLRPAAIAIGDAKYWDCPLDIAMQRKTGDPFTNKNPSYQIAFYIQHSGLNWGILTNGRLWRLYHRSTAHKLDHFYEVDVPALLSSGDVTKFLYFYAFFRRAAFNPGPLSIAAILQESIDYAAGISESLRDQVYEALRHVAQGFLDYPPNQLTPDEPETLKHIYDASLILLYRLLFILYAEARDLLPLDENATYREIYSLSALKEQIVNYLNMGLSYRSNSAMLYGNLTQLFDYINVGDPPLYISTFNGGLFDPQRHEFLLRYKVSDARMQAALDMLARVNHQFIDYRDLSVRNLGTIYEGLLEYHLVKSVEPQNWIIALVNDKGERKATGSYYTPDVIVKYIVEQTVGPVVQQAAASAPTDTAKVDAVLAIKVLDPAMGSGHFLVEATEYIARFLVELNIKSGTQEADLAYWKRRVVQSCIYGVDLNPLAVELAKLSLWLSTVAKDRPLSFLDHHLRTGNALIGARFADLILPTNGNGNGKNGNGHNGHGTRKAKKESPKDAKEQLTLFNDDTFRQNITTAVDLMWLVEDNPAQTVEQVKEQEHLYATMREGLTGKYGRLADLVTATSYGVTVDNTLWKPLVDFATGRINIAPPQFQQWLDAATTIAAQRRFFHWELEFPEVFFDRHGQHKGTNAGFHAVVGNPPWIRQESFSDDKTALNRLYRVYRGSADLYTYFVELGNNFLIEKGHFGFLVPNKFVRASYGEPLRQFLGTNVQLERLIDFGDLRVFHDAVTYPMIVLTTKQPHQDAQVSYIQLKQIPMSHEDLAVEVESNSVLLASSTFAEAEWSLMGEKIQAALEKIRAVGTPLDEYVHGKFYRGILTGLNEAFVIDRDTRDRLIAQDRKSKELIKPFVVGRDVKRYRLDYQNRYLIFTRRGIDLTRYKAIEQHLLQFKDQLEPKPLDWNEDLQGEWRGRKSGPYKWYEIQDSIGYYEEFEKPKIIYPNICRQPEFMFDDKGYYSNQKTYIISTDDIYLLAILNSQVMNFIFKVTMPMLRGGFFEPGYVFMKDVPIRSIAFNTSAEEREVLMTRCIAHYNVERDEELELLTLVEACLTHQPEQSDVAHDLLVYLAEQMIDFYKQRQEAVENVLFGLESILPQAVLQKIYRLWTPLNPERASEKEIAEAQAVLGSLASRTIELQDEIGQLKEEQWKWLVLRRLHQPNLAKLVRVYREYQPAVAAVDERLKRTNEVIDQIVYRLYGLTREEIAIVEGTNT